LANRNVNKFRIFPTGPKNGQTACAAIDYSAMPPGRQKSFSGLATPLANRAIYAYGKTAEFKTALHRNAV
jgi:hypothetical protein